MASYNYARYLDEAISSVINQSYQNWELIIVDDGSNDNSIEIIKSYCQKDNRIKLLEHENGVNKGLKETILLGLENITGDWVAFLESDDVFNPDNLTKKVKTIQKYPDVKLIFNKVDFLSEKQSKRKNIFENTQKKLSKMSFPKNMFCDFYIDNMILTFSCVMVEANTLKNADFSTPVDVFLDWWLWIQLAYENNFYYIDEELTQWRLHEKSYIKMGKKPLFPPQFKIYSGIYKKNKQPLPLYILILQLKFILTRSFRFLFNSRSTL